MKREKSSKEMYSLIRARRLCGVFDEGGLVCEDEAKEVGDITSAFFGLQESSLRASSLSSSLSILERLRHRRGRAPQDV